METIINQITASQGLSAVAVLVLFNLLFLIFYAFVIGKAFDRIKEQQIVSYNIQLNIEDLKYSVNNNQEQLELLKNSHSELNQTFVLLKNSIAEKVVSVNSENTKRVAELEKELAEAIERGQITTKGINLKFEEYAQRLKNIEIIKTPYIPTNKRISNLKVAQAKKDIAETLQKKTNEVPTIQKIDSIFLQKKMKNLPRFKINSIVKTNTGSFYGTIIERLVENNKYIYLVKNRATKQKRWFSESTLRFQ